MGKKVPPHPPDIHSLQAALSELCQRVARLEAAETRAKADVAIDQRLTRPQAARPAPALTARHTETPAGPGRQLTENISAEECNAARRRLVQSRGPARRTGLTAEIYYTERILKAAINPATTAPRLYLAALACFLPPPPLCAEDGAPIPAHYDLLVRRRRKAVDAIDDEDEAESKRAASQAEALAQAHAALVAVALRSAAPTADPQLLHALGAIGSEVARIADHLVGPEIAVVGSQYVARKIGKTTRTVCNYARSGEIPRDCVVDWGGDGGLWKFHRPKIDAWIQRRAAGATPPARG